MWGQNCWWGPGYFFGGPSGMIISLIFWVLIIVGLIYFFSWIIRRSKGESPKSSETALDILKRRYASGEISAEEFARVKKDLT